MISRERGWRVRMKCFKQRVSKSRERERERERRRVRKK